MQNHASPILVLLAQVAAILALSRVVGMLFKRVGQPQVMGEIVAGIMLGPSLLGWGWPGGMRWLFPKESIAVLQVLSQLGVTLFLFLVGLDFDAGLMRSKGKSAAAISVSSILVPFVGGVVVAMYLYPRVFDDPGHGHYAASLLFMGSAMSLTAFPVMARILTERNIQKTQVGIISITSAAVNDILAWCLLAFVVAIARYEGPVSGFRTAGLAGVFVAVLFLGVRPLLKRVEGAYGARGHLSADLVALIFLLILGSAYAAERIGIHALFGAFALGVVMPKSPRFVRQVSEKLEDFTVVFLLPLFFAYAGLLLDLTKMRAGDLWGYTGLVVLVACLGKFGGAAAAGRLTGLPWRESAAVGALMNARGLIELVILTIGIQLGVINETAYAMMVIMAIVTTALTTPVLHAVYPRRLFERERAEARRFETWSVMIPVSLPRSGPPLLQVARVVAERRPGAGIAAAHFRRAAEEEAYQAAAAVPAEAEDAGALAPLLREAHEAGIEVEAARYVAGDFAEGIVAAAAERRAGLILMGFHKPLIGQALLGGTVHRVLTESPTDVGVFVDRGLRGINTVLVPYLGGVHDRFALELAGRMARNAKVAVTVLSVIPPGADAAKASRETAADVQGAMGHDGVTIRVVEDESPVDAALRESPRYDLVLIGVSEEWGLGSSPFGLRPERVARDCPTSLLLVRKGKG